MESKSLKYSTEIKIIQESIHKLNPEFSLCDILVCYHGRNRNRTSISKELIEQKLFSIYGIPIIGEWIRLEEDQNVETWGSHGGRIILDDSGIKYEQTTKPFGFVTKEAQENASWVTITEKDGHTQNEYLSLKKCIIWNQRYEECNSILEKNYGQSMEISNVDGKYTDDGCLELSDFIFSALCILGDECPPCFESASISAHKEYSEFKQEYQFMLEKYKEFNLSQDGLNIKTQKNAADNKKKEKEEKILLDKNQIFSQLTSALSQLTFKSNTDKYYEKYIYLSHDDNSINLVDREDCYKLYNIPYFATEANDSVVVNIDYEKKELRSFVVGDKIEDEFDLKSEIDMISNDFSNHNVAKYNSTIIEDLNSKIEGLNETYSVAQAEISRLRKQLIAFESEKKEIMNQKHKETIDALIDSKYDEMKDFSEYAMYRVNMEDNYRKTIEEVSNDIKNIHYNFLSSKKQSNKQHSFSVIETSVIDDNNLMEYDGIAKQYGAEVAKYFQTN